MILQKAISLLVGYMFGLIETGYFYGKWKHVDLKSAGSGNTGTTNAVRVMGKKAGAIVFIGDFLKCLIPVLLMRLVIAPYLEGGAQDALVYAFYVGLGVVLGHNFPFYLKFQGGKGIACTACLVIVLDPLVAVFGEILFFATLYFTGYVSLASLLGVPMAFIGIILHEFWGGSDLSSCGQIELVVLSVIITALAYYKHRTNIVRLLNGTENKFRTRKQK